MSLQHLDHDSLITRHSCLSHWLRTSLLDDLSLTRFRSHFWSAGDAGAISSPSILVVPFMTLTPFSPDGKSAMESEDAKLNSATAMPLSHIVGGRESGDPSAHAPTTDSGRKIFGKTSSKSAPSSPPVTTVTAASPEPPAPTVAPEKVLSSTSSPDRSLSLSSPSHAPRSPVKSMQYIQAPGAGTRRRGSSNAPAPVGSRRRSREFVPGPIRRASQVLISLTSPDGASLYGECSRRDSRAVPQITLMSSTFQRLPMKDFGAEVRASMDVDQFLQQAVLLLDVNETSLEGIVDRIVKKVSPCSSGRSIQLPSLLSTTS